VWRDPLPIGSHRSVLVTTLLAVLSAAVLSAAFFLANPSTSPRTTVGFLFLALAVDLMLVAMVVLQGVRPGVITAEGLGLRWERVPAGLNWGLAGGLGLLGISIVNGLVLQALGLQNGQAEMLQFLRELPRPQALLVVAAGALAAPIAEELFFRGYVFQAYLRTKGAATAYVGSAIIFGLLHAQLTLTVALVVMGLVLAYLYRRSATIIAPILAHVLNNGVAFLALLAVTPSS
jgi:membrane protease YdiL (CAAX protease family)